MRTVTVLTAQRAYGEPLRVERSWRVSPAFQVFAYVIQLRYPEMLLV